MLWLDIIVIILKCVIIAMWYISLHRDIKTKVKNEEDVNGIVFQVVIIILLCLS